MSDVSKRILGLSAAKRGLLEALLGTTQAAQTIPRRTTTDPAPLSFAQQRLWFLTQLESDNPVYNIPAVRRVRGALRPDALEQAVARVVARHEALRTVFAATDGDPVQVVRPAVAVPLKRVDLRHLPPDQREGEAMALTVGEVRALFDLTAGPLLRTTLYQLDEQEYILVLVMHHICSDGWSAGVFFTELAACYEAQLRGAEAALPELPIQYADFAQWQRESLSGETLEKGMAYWRQQLAGAPAALELPGGKPRPVAQSFQGSKYSFTLPASLTEAARTLSRAEGATLFMTLLAAFQALLYRYTGQEDVVVGSPIAGRTRKELERLIGFFVNTQVLRTRFGGAPTFRETLRQVKETVLDAMAYQDVPFERLVQELAPRRDLSRSPLFQVMFVLQNAGQPLSLHGVTLEHLSLSGGTSMFDLTLGMEERDGGLAADIQYSTDLFDEAYAARLATHFRVLLEGALANPDALVTDLPLLTEAERDLQLVMFNETARPYTLQPIHRLVEEQAERTPEATALVWGAERFTYADLNRRANRIAHHLRAAGVGPETLVGICAGRTPAMVAGLLGILKAGGAYVPLDPAYPPERLAFIQEDAQVAITLTDALLAEILARPDLPQQNPDGGAGLQNLAYVIYTSGSTGRPKGVAIEHRSAATLIRWAHETYTPAELAGVLAATSICFDLSVFELFVTLSGGGQVILAENALQLPALPAAGEVTLVNTVPSAMTELVRLGAVPTSVRVVNLAGEPLPGTLAQALYRLPHVTKVYNLYGPSEDTTYSTYTLVERDAVKPSIGRPLPNSRAYLLDANRQPVPLGLPGEVYLGGDGLARGYLSRPELTAERFVDSPWGRLYRTGDLARYLPDGRLDYLGRIDHQVKIRGFRMELGEIEAVLGAHPAVGDRVVVAWEDEAGDKQLVGYYVATAAISAAELRAHLQTRLPEYMIPAHFVALDALPLTPNGKIDRKALPAPQQDRAGAPGEPFTPTRGPVEAVVAAIWAEVLKLEQVSATTTFFELGGHSLLATRVIARIQELFGVPLPLRAFFEAPTVQGLAAALCKDPVVGAVVHQVAELLLLPEEEAAVSLQTEEREMAPRDPSEPLELSFAQQRMWFLDRVEPNNPRYIIPGAFRLKGALSVPALSQAFDEIVRRHEALRTIFPVEAGRPAPRVVAPYAVPLPMTDLSHLPAAEREAEALRLAHAEAARPFDLGAGPLFRAALVRMGPDDHIVVFSFHHIVTDGQALSVFFRELNALYGAFAAGRPSPLPELPLQYGDVAAWQRRWLEGAEMERQAAYWRERLAGPLPVLELPTDRPRPAVQTYRGATVPVAVDRPLVDALQALARQENATLFMVLLAAYNVLLHRYSGQTDLCVGTPIANRNREDMEGLIGVFANTLVLRTDLGGRPTFREVLRRVREAALGAYAHQDLPFERLVELLKPERSTSHTPLFQALFNLQFRQQAARELSGLTLEEVPLALPVAKFDLTLSLVQSDQGLSGIAEYNADLFDETTVQRMGLHYRTLLAAVVDDADLPIDRMRLMTQAELAQFEAWNDTAMDLAGQLPVHRLFEAQAERSPEALALAAGGERLTYAELNRRANRLAHYLRMLGVGPEVLVAVSMERTADLLVALLAVLKAGGAYVPLDPTYPQNRLAWITEDAQPRLTLTEERVAQILARPDLPESNLTGGSGPDHLAYVIYTSGSTGRPKGVQVQHGSLTNLLLATQRAPGMAAADVMAAVSSISFDIAALELYLPLISGAAVVLVSREEGADGARLAGLLEASGATVMQATPATWRLLLAAGWQSRPGFRIFAGGEALPYDLAQRLLEGGGELWNLYGPTETTIWSTCCRVEPGERITVGRPLANTQLYVLDEHLRPAPVGVPGELYIGGVGVARGYLNRPDLTAERFVQTSRGRLYRTGDLARFLPDGRVDFLGRNDFQVKIRGYRIELGEIEAVLERHPAVKQAVVTAREDGSGELGLVGYLVPAAGPVDLAALRAFLAQSLPPFMLPSAFVELDALPLTPNAKIDRKALPSPDQFQRVASVAFVAPDTPVERTIAAVWQAVLRLDQVGLHDNFFDLGGHSLLLVQVQTRLSQELRREVPLLDLFHYPTVAALAAHLAGPAEGDQSATAAAGARGAARRELLERLRRRTDRT